jgi:hypothetical protein
VNWNPEKFEALLRAAERSALHLEMRDGYMRSAPMFIAWQEGHRYDPSKREEWWRPWLDLTTEVSRRGVDVRRARIVSEPISDYVRFEYDLTFTNIAGGEKVRWLPRRRATNLALPGNDFWLIDEKLVLVNHFTGNGESAGSEVIEDPALAKFCATAFEAVWERAVPHEEYRPA